MNYGFDKPDEAQNSVGERVKLALARKNGLHAIQIVVLYVIESRQPRCPIDDNTPLSAVIDDERSVNSLERIGIRTVGQLCTASDEQLLSAPMFGEMGVKKVRAAVETALAEDVEQERESA